MEEPVFSVGYKQASLPLSLKILTLIGKTSPRQISDRWLTQRNEKRRSIHRRYSSTDSQFSSTQRVRSCGASNENSPRYAQNERTAQRKEELTWLERQCEELNRKTEAYLRASQSALNRAKMRPVLSIDPENIGKLEFDESTVKAKIKPFVKTKSQPRKKKSALRRTSSQREIKQKENEFLPPQYQRRLNKY
mmetsp:Transcript_2424/g.5674  ORF Transcript_2424/g.5674 Transcript_2424/m.5674 type:complete len:192 (+) Transcript_2424:23-598(+)